ncbi:unnamed protein product [Prunus armeniaca]|uniref:Uncharacterized protein n=1 Tax=Prunus armeniaca TaxID=36596 RepID=A0A6J5VJZ5_PRUAR|nr:unnamed protein product [Prunus armeniaca]
MLDLTHPDTASWFKQILQEMVDDGVRGGWLILVKACLWMPPLFSPLKVAITLIMLGSDAKSKRMSKLETLE